MITEFITCEIARVLSEYLCKKFSGTLSEEPDDSAKLFKAGRRWFELFNLRNCPPQSNTNSE